MTLIKDKALPSELISIVARLDLAKLDMIGDCPVYQISEPWKMTILAGEAESCNVRTAGELEAAMQDETISQIIVPKFSFGLSMLERILSRYPISKTIYWEA